MGPLISPAQISLPGERARAAGYSFRDFIRVATPLVILVLGALSFLLAYHYQL